MIRAAQPGTHTHTTASVIIRWHLDFFSSPIWNAAACSLLVRHEEPAVLKQNAIEMWCTSALCKCTGWTDHESNRCCVYIGLHLAWVCRMRYERMSVLRTVRALVERRGRRRRRSNIPSVFKKMFLLLFGVSFILAVIRFSFYFISMFVHSLFCFVSIFWRSFHFVCSECACVRGVFATCSLLLCLVRQQPCGLMTVLCCCRRRVIFIFVSRSVRVGYSHSVFSAVADSFSRSLTQHCMRDHMCWKRKTRTQNIHTISF